VIDAQLPGRWKEYVQSIVNANGTRGKILVDVAPPLIDPAVAGETAIPGETGVRQRIFTGGQRVIDGSISSGDGTARSARIWIARQTSLYANMGAPQIPTTTTITRTVGSFITDGYQIGDMIAMFGAATDTNNGLIQSLTAVAAATLTTNTTMTIETSPPSTLRIFRIALRTQRAVPASAGFLDATPPVVLLGGTQDPASAAQPDIGWSLSADGAIMVAVVAAVTSGAQMQFHAMSALY
jgi:hypothetical protein